MKTLYLTVLCSLLFFNSFGQLDSTFYYNPNGTKHWWHIQKDIISFRCTNNQPYSGSFNPSQVGYQNYWANDGRKMNEVHLTQSCSPMQVAQIVNQIRTSSDFDIFSYAITETPSVPCDQNEFYNTDDQILVLFHSMPTQSEINYLIQEYDLDLMHEPSGLLPSQGNYTFVFKVNLKQGSLYTSFEISQQIFENEPSLIYAVKPNLYYKNAITCVDENVPDPSGTLGTWFINNTGGVIWNNKNGANDADADLCECWEEGYTGSGIKVGVVDVASLEFDHPDLATIVKAYDISGASAAELTTNFTLDINIGHSMNVLGTIGATPNNTSLGQRFAVGAAYDADLYAYIAPSINDVFMATGLQQALVDQVDVVNMSFRLPQNFFMDNAIQNLITMGRPDVNAPNGFWGTVIVASSGNDDLMASNYPANHPDVIGAGGSNPRDYRWSSNPPDGEGWSTNSSQGSTYGPPSYNYDVVAPSELIMTVDAVNYGAQGSYNIQIGTSFASPIVSGIAAILLDKNPAQSYQTIRQAIRDGAEKVHSSDYDYNAFAGSPGYSEEMFYGRVSCSNSLNLVTADVSEITEILDLVILNQGEGVYEVILPENLEGGELTVYAIDGSIVSQLNSESASSIQLDLSNVSSGMYVLILNNSYSTIGMSKLVK